ncbi:hypothetical protein V1264_021006 [Littorina saxatilis]|uniref:Uncharacterized protein n=1 Tax=Littorina saxatilis TaxID=31220 RepID=A0AAN9GC38_9CAEN
MFSQWAVEVLKRLTVRFQPKIQLAYPIRFIADLLFSFAVFLWLNRRPVSNYNLSYWSQLLYLVQLFKVVYTLRFLLVELVFRELRTFFCFINPLVTKLAIVRRWQSADPCVLKVVNMSFFLVFIGLNLFLAYGIEWMSRCIWSWLTTPRGCGTNLFYLPKPLVFSKLKKRRKGRGKRYRIRGKTRSPSTKIASCGFWSRIPLGTRSKSPSSRSSSATSSNQSGDTCADSLPKGYRGLSLRETRSGKNY